MNKIAISVIVLCHNTRGLELCVESIARQLEAEDELILVDDHSSELFWNRIHLELPEQGRRVTVPDPGGNRSQNRNLGARNAKNPILVFTDGDIIVSQNALELLRTAYAQRTDVAYIGTEHGMKFDLNQAQCYYGRTDYLADLASLQEREQLYHDPLFGDWRGADLSNPEDQPYFWLRFYTSFCAVRQDVFWRAGGFDESFSYWGAEDVDLGYRISLEGTIGYLSQIHSIHVPHPRDSFRNELTNRRNTYYMLSKYLLWQFEALVIFGSTPSMLRTIEAVLRHIRTVKLTPLLPGPSPNTLYIDAPCSTTWFDQNAGETHRMMIGMAIPKRNRSFTRVVISDHIFLYPEAIVVRILQEALRVGKEVELHKAEESVRIAWNNANPITGIPFPRICRYAWELFDFQFIPKSETVWKVQSSVYGNTPDPWGETEENRSPQNGVVLINLSSEQDGDAADWHLLLTGCETLAAYHFTPVLDQNGHCLLCESIPGDFSRMNSTLAYCVDDIAAVGDRQQWMTYRGQARHEILFDRKHQYSYLGC